MIKIRRYNELPDAGTMQSLFDHAINEIGLEGLANLWMVSIEQASKMVSYDTEITLKQYDDVLEKMGYVIMEETELFYMEQSCYHMFNAMDLAWQLLVMEMEMKGTKSINITEEERKSIIANENKEKPLRDICIFALKEEEVPGKIFQNIKELIRYIESEYKPLLHEHHRAYFTDNYYILWGYVILNSIISVGFGKIVEKKLIVEPSQVFPLLHLSSHVQFLSGLVEGFWLMKATARKAYVKSAETKKARKENEKKGPIREIFKRHGIKSYQDYATLDRDKTREIKIEGLCKAKLTDCRMFNKYTKEILDEFDNGNVHSSDNDIIERIFKEWKQTKTTISSDKNYAIID